MTASSRDAERRAQDQAAAEADWRRRDASASAAGYGGLVPGTGVCWLGRARMAHARRLAGLALDADDVKAIAAYPEMPPLVSPR